MLFVFEFRFDFRAISATSALVYTSLNALPFDYNSTSRSFGHSFWILKEVHVSEPPMILLSTSSHRSGLQSLSQTTIREEAFVV